MTRIPNLLVTATVVVVPPCLTVVAGIGVAPEWATNLLGFSAVVYAIVFGGAIITMILGDDPPKRRGGDVLVTAPMVAANAAAGWYWLASLWVVALLLSLTTYHEGQAPND